MRLERQNISFKGAHISLNAISDTHGCLSDVSSGYQKIKDNAKDMFLPEKRGNLNIMTIVGDWFMSGTQRGYLSNPNATSNHYQIRFFNEFISNIRALAENIQTFFVLGNHEFDGSVKQVKRIVSKAKTKIICTNLDYENSPLLKKDIINKKIIKSQIIEIPDDRNLEKTHKILVLGLSPVNLSSYNQSKGIDFIDNVQKKETMLTKKDSAKTVELFDAEIKKFKQENPNGVVILLSHCKSNIAKRIALKSGKVNLILSGHEHGNAEVKLKNTTFIELFKDFKKISNVKIDIDDNGHIQINSKNYHPEIGSKNHRNEMQRFYETIFAKDLKPLCPIHTSNDFEKFDISNIRFDNNSFSDYVTNVILTKIQEIESDVDFFLMGTSAIRRELPTEKQRFVNNWDIINALNGITPENAKIYKGEVSGRNLISIIIDNSELNRLNKIRNAINAYGGLIVDKNILKAAQQGASMEDLSKFITVEQTNKPIELDKIYKMAFPFRWIHKYCKIPALKENASQLHDVNVKNLFAKYFFDLAENNAQKIIYATPER